MRYMVKTVGSVLTMSRRKLTHNYGCPRFHAREREAKEERGKNESAERERKKYEFALFPPFATLTRFQSPKPLGRENQGS